MSELKISPKTDINLREENQDVFGHYDTPYGDLFVVADGMGGVNGGFTAADTAVGVFPVALREAHGQGMEPRTALRFAMDRVNNRIFVMAKEDVVHLRGMGCTLVVALETESGFLIGHVGDSRVYLVQSHGIRPLTKDHSYVGRMLEAGLISWQEARTHPQRGVLSRAVGPRAQVVMEQHPDWVQLSAGEGLLMCSDGLCGFVSDEQIFEELNAVRDKRQIAERLIDLAKQNGSDDNITVLYIHKPPAGATLTVPAAPPRRGGKHRGSQTSTMGVPVWTAPLALLLCCALGFWLTYLHFRGQFSLETYTPPSKRSVLVAEIDRSELFSWAPESCVETAVGAARTALAEFESELRKSLPVTDEEERLSGERLAAEFQKRFEGRIDGNVAWTTYLREVGAILMTAEGIPAGEIHIHYVDDDLENAFALPGGHIYFFRGLLEKRLHNEAQLAFVLAHEIMHVKKGHALARLQIIKQFPEAQQPTLGRLISHLMTHPFRKSQEQEADASGLKLLMDVGYSPYQAVGFVEARINVHPVEKNEGSFDFLLREMEDLLATHPDDTLRVCLLKNLTLRQLAQSERHTFYVGTTNYRQKIPKTVKLF